MNDNHPMPSEGQQRAWVAQWLAARSALAAQRAIELRALSDEQARAAADALLAIGAHVPAPDGRLRSSGLVQQQALLHARVAR